jgi:hypothetical protein
MPFSTAEFMAVFGRYNQAVWPAQFILNLLALALVAILLWVPAGSRWVAGGLALLWAWMAVAYHFAFFTRINPAAWGFGLLFLAGAFAFAWLGVRHERLHFAPEAGVRGWLGGVLIGYALVVYPLLADGFGQRYPQLPTFGLPCPTTIFTLGMLMFAVAPVPRAALAVPLLWSAIGSVAAFQLGVVQDGGLPVAGLLALAALAWPRSPQGAGRAGMPTGT